MRKLSTLGLVVFLFAGGAYSQDQPLSAQQIMDRMISGYASCNRYVDEGEVRTVFIKATGRRTVIKPFSPLLSGPQVSASSLETDTATTISGIVT